MTKVTREDCLYGWSAAKGGRPKGPYFGKKGQGRAAILTTVTVHLTYEGNRYERTIGPGYTSKKKWRELQEAAVEEMLKEINERG